MKKSLLLFLLLVIAAVAHAQRIQVVDIDGLPIAAVCVTNEKGALVGTTDNEGWLDDVKGVNHLFFSHVAFKAKEAKMDTIPSMTVVMQDVKFELSELEVRPKELLYVQTYYRCVYVCDEGPLYFRAGVVDNTYEFANKKINAKTRSVAKGENGLLRFLLSTFGPRTTTSMRPRPLPRKPRTGKKGKRKRRENLLIAAIMRFITSTRMDNPALTTW